jgi:uncharacterized protein (DUF1499 family)
MSNSKPARLWSLLALAVAIAFCAATAYLIAGSRNDLVGYPTAFAWLRYIALAGIGVFAIAAVTYVMAARARDSRAKLYAGLAAVIVAVLSGTMALNEAALPEGPLMNDITTDLEDPPRFNAVIALRPRGSNTVEHGGPEMAAAQRRVHPEVQPILSALAPDAAFERALEVAEEMGWDIVARDASTGIFEAVDTTPFFRFKDDIVVRVRPRDGGSRIDLRSHSRIGLTDLGKNAARIMEFTRAFPLRG